MLKRYAAHCLHGAFVHVQGLAGRGTVCEIKHTVAFLSLCTSGEVPKHSLLLNRD